MKRVQILAMAVIAAAWTRIIAAQPPLPRPLSEPKILDKNGLQAPGAGKDWRRFGSGLEDDYPMAPRIRFGSRLAGKHPIAAAVRFGSGLEDDAPVRPPNVLHLSGLEDLTSVPIPVQRSRSVRFGSGLEEEHPVATRVRFGSGLEDDAPRRPHKVIYQPGF